MLRVPAGEPVFPHELQAKSSWVSSRSHRSRSVRREAQLLKRKDAAVLLCVCVRASVVYRCLSLSLFRTHSLGVLVG